MPKPFYFSLRSKFSVRQMSKYPVIGRKLFSCYMSFKGIRMAELWWYQMTISLVTKNQGKSRQPLPQISSNLHATMKQVPHPPIWKWKPPYSGTFSFSKYSSTPRSGFKKWHKNIVLIFCISVFSMINPYQVISRRFGAKKMLKINKCY